MQLRNSWTICLFDPAGEARGQCRCTCPPAPSSRSPLQPEVGQTWTTKRGQLACPLPVLQTPRLHPRQCKNATSASKCLPATLQFHPNLCPHPATQTPTTQEIKAGRKSGQEAVWARRGGAQNVKGPRLGALHAARTQGPAKAPPSATGIPHTQRTVCNKTQSLAAHKPFRSGVCCS